VAEIPAKLQRLNTEHRFDFLFGCSTDSHDFYWR
jgi:hypothetical protein